MPDIHWLAVQSVSSPPAIQQPPIKMAQVIASNFLDLTLTQVNIPISQK